MNPVEHLNHIVTWFIGHVTKKYMQGQHEHGGRLWRKPVWKFMRDEVIDMVVYFQVLEEQQQEVMTKLEQALNELRNEGSDPLIVEHFVQQAWNLLEHGNEDGTPEEEK